LEGWIYGGAYNSSGFIEFSALGAPTTAYRPNLNDTIALGDGTIVPWYKSTSTADCFNSFDTQYVSALGDV
jgi:hypothetical protein